MSEKNFLQDILDKLSIKVDKVELDLQNFSLNLGEKSTSIESGEFTISNIYKGDSLITPRINMNIKNVNIPLEELMPILEAKLKKAPPKKELPENQ